MKNAKNDNTVPLAISATIDTAIVLSSIEPPNGRLSLLHPSPRRRKPIHVALLSEHSLGEVQALLQLDHVLLQPLDLTG
jgi:hypothetical protein